MSNQKRQRPALRSRSSSWEIHIGWILGRRKDRPVVLAFEHTVSLARQGAYVAGWLADPADQLESLFVEIDGGSSIDPLGSNRSGRRADARTRLEPKLRGLKIGLHELREPEFCCFVPATGVATSQSGRATATLKSGGPSSSHSRSPTPLETCSTCCAAPVGPRSLRRSCGSPSPA